MEDGKRAKRGRGESEEVEEESEEEDEEEGPEKKKKKDEGGSSLSNAVDFGQRLITLYSTIIRRDGRRI